MDTIKFANGETHDCSFFGTAPSDDVSTAIIALADVDFAQAASIFSDASKTSTIEIGEYRLIDYTNLVMLGVQPYGIQAVLKGGHDERKT